MANRPTFYTLIDRTESNVNADYIWSTLNFTGYQPGSIVDSETHNTLWLTDGLWQTYLDYQTARTADSVDATTPQRWTTTRLAYQLGFNVTDTFNPVPVVTYATYFFDGYRLQIDDFLLKPADASPLLFPFPVAKPGRIWIYVNTSAIVDPIQPYAAIRVDSDVPGAPATPGAQELALVGVDIDAGGITIGNSYPPGEPAEEVVFGLRAQRWTGPVQFDNTVDMLSTVNFTEVIVTAPLASGQVGLTVVGAGDTFAGTFDGLGWTALVATNASVQPTFIAAQTGTGRAAFMQNSDVINCTLKVEQGGDGCAVEAEAAGAGIAVKGENTGTGSGGEFLNSATAAALIGTNAGAGTAVFARNTGTGTALEANNNDATNPAIQAFNAGGGFAITGIGDVRVVGTVHATTGYQGTGSTVAALPEGATVADSKNIIGGTGTTYQAESITALETATGKRLALTSEQAATGDRQIHHLDGEPRWNDTTDDYFHHGPEPWGPIGSSPALAGFGPLSTPTQGPVVSVTLVAASYIMITAGCDIGGTDASTVARIRILVNAVEVFNTVYSVPLGDTDVVWSKTFAHLGSAGTFDVELEFDRSAGIGNVNVANADVVVVPV